MGTAFFDARQKRMKLNGTICLYKGEPYHVDAHDNLAEHMVFLVPVGSNRRGRAQAGDLCVDYRDKEFDYSSPPLGYTNLRPHAHYLARFPDRQAQQGLFYSQITDLGSGPSARAFDPYVWFYSSAAGECIKGIYPTLEECVEAVTSLPLWRSCAFHRHFAVQRLGRKGLELMYRGRGVGSTTKAEGTPHFVLYPDKDNSNLRELLENIDVSCE